VSKIDPQIELVLASSSPFRQRLLGQLSVEFRALNPDIDESPLPNEKPEALVRRLSIAKARAVVPRAPAALIVGSDQVAFHCGEIVGKPRNHADAVAQLLSSSGKTITFFTGVALLNSTNGNLQTKVVPYAVRFRTLTRIKIDHYLEREQPYGCCGSLRADGLGIALLDWLRGEDPTALIGLPLTILVQMLEKEGFRVL
jgi:septum formation protein